MAEACLQRAREAAQKEVQQGESTARTKWTQQETELFKAALANYGPFSNIKLAAEIGTRSAAQDNIYICTFLKAYPSWVLKHYHPAALVDGTVCSSRSSAHSPSSQPSESQTPPGPSKTQGQRTVGNRTRPAAPTVPSRWRRGSPPASSTSPPPTPPGAAAAGQQLPTRTPTPHT